MQEESSLMSNMIDVFIDLLMNMHTDQSFSLIILIWKSKAATQKIADIKTTEITAITIKAATRYGYDYTTTAGLLVLWVSIGRRIGLSIGLLLHNLSFCVSVRVIHPYLQIFLILIYPCSI